MQRAHKNALAKYRKRYDVQQKHMAQLIGKDKFYICRAEKGLNQPALETVLVYSIMFGVDVKELVPELHEELQKLLADYLEKQEHLFSDKRSYNLVRDRVQSSLKENLIQKDYEL